MMNRVLLFWLGCMGTRLALVFLAAYVSKPVLAWVGWAALIPASGFWFLYLTGLRPTGIEATGGRIWWNHLRPVHGTLYSIFAGFAITGHQELAWKTLLADFLLGAGAWLQKNDFIL
jgi:hypothetical protein